MIVDRGFRNCEAALINFGFIVKMPTCWEFNKLSTKDANESRLVTRVRYNVERVNGVMKSVFKIFLNTVDVHYIPKIMDDFAIAAALINKRSNTVRESDRTIALAKAMKLREKVPNELSGIVETKEFDRLIRCKSYEKFEDFQCCPLLNMDDLEMISFGSYQVKQARCYLSNHLLENNLEITIFRFFEEDVANTCSIFITPDMEPLLLMANLKSRFVSSTFHRTFVLIDKMEEGPGAVLAYCCSCKAGNRTAGCCSHVMSILYFVSYARNGVQEVSKHLKNVFTNNNWENNANGDENEDHELDEDFNAEHAEEMQ